MKRKWIHPEEPEASRTHWRSEGELQGSEEFQGWLQREFPQGAAELEGGEDSRRGFLKLMGASTALAGFGVACSRPLRHLVPFNDHVEWLVPGRALYYSSAKPRLNGVGCDPLVVSTFEGRPTKVDGNRLHPAKSGGSDAYTQASILDLYDQDRSKGYLKSGSPTTRKDFEEGYFNAFQKAGSGSKTAFVLPRSTSPTRNRLLAELAARYSGASFYTCAPLDSVGSDQASEELYGKGIVPVPQLDKAEKIFSLDCDFLGYEPVGEDSMAEFFRGRNVDGVDGAVNRLYVAEAAFTLTGGTADHRYRISPSQILSIALLLASELAAKTGDAGLAAIAAAGKGKVNSSVFNLDWIRECAADLAVSAGKSLVLAGSRHDREVHLVVAAINQALGAFGPVVSLVNHKLPEFKGISDLAKSIDGGAVEHLFIVGESDPVFDAPSELKFGELLGKVANVVHLSNRLNQTAKAADWHVPGAHYLESWGDHWSCSGVYSVQQPMIDPLWGGVSENAFLLSLLADAEGNSDLPLDAVKKTFAAVGGADWVAALRDGFAKGPKLEKSTAVNAGGAAAALGSVEIADLPYPEALEVVLATSGSCYDGRFANNGWLQEAPDPITKLTWDNAALISFHTAEEMGLEDGDLVSLSVEDREVRVPVLRSPGHADYTLTLPVGYYGKKGLGIVEKGVGFNAYPLATVDSSYIVSGVSLSLSEEKYPLALTAEHYSMEGRAIAREGTVEMLKEDEHFAQHQGMDHHVPETVSLYKGFEYQNLNEDKVAQNESNQSPAFDGHEFKVDPLHQWAMTVDLNSCTGCNACVIACQAENNIPIVGKDQVMRGREMHWIRMDRYFTSPNDHKTVAEQGIDFEANGTPGRRKVDDDNIEMINQPVACQQCESAPCETVCPVNATTHTSDGLNAMTYNRCIGTRYCANNCPYKARRFNFYDYNKRPLDKLIYGPLAPANGHGTTTQQLQKNPNVTVRMRGVIEKCTYCVQRISAAKIGAKVAARDSDDIQVPANSFTVACQDACGSSAIVFGNLMNKKDRINGMKTNPRNYDLLKYVGAMPRTSYLAKIKNPNPKMPGADKVGTVTSKMH